MDRTLLAVLTVAGVLLSGPAVAGGPDGVTVVARHYDALDLAEGRIRITAAGNEVWVSGTAPGGPWLEVWSRSGGRWTRIAEIEATEMAPIRFGAKRDRTCRRIS